MKFDTLSEFVAAARVDRQADVAYIRLKLRIAEVNLYGFESKCTGKSDYQIKEEGFAHLQMVKQYLKKQP
jgi:hypothetical protein